MEFESSTFLVLFFFFFGLFFSQDTCDNSYHSSATFRPKILLQAHPDILKCAHPQLTFHHKESTWKNGLRWRSSANFQHQ